MEGARNPQLADTLIAAEMPRPITLQFGDEIRQPPVAGDQHVAGPGIALGRGPLHRSGLILAERQLLTGLDPHRLQPASTAHFHRVLEHANPAHLAVAANDETGAQRANAALRGVHDKGSVEGIAGGLDQHFTVQQVHLAHLGAVADVHGTGGVELHLSAVVEPQ